MNYDDLARQISKWPDDRVPRDPLYYVLKRELSKKGYWKNRPRGEHKPGQMNPKK